MKKLSVFLLVVFIILSCSESDDSSNFTGTAQLNITSNLINSSGFTSNALNFDSGYIWVSEIQFEANVVNSGSVSRSVEQFSKIDFVTGISDPIIENFIIPAGDYSSVDLSVELRDEDSQPCILIEGTYTRTDASIAPIRFEFNSGETFEVESNNTVTVAPGTTAISSIVIDPIAWFSVVPTAMLDNANVNPSGTIVISSSSNEDIFDLVEERLDQSTETTFE